MTIFDCSDGVTFWSRVPGSTRVFVNIHKQLFHISWDYVHAKFCLTSMRLDLGDFNLFKGSVRLTETQAMHQLEAGMKEYIDFKHRSASDRADAMRLVSLSAMAVINEALKKGHIHEYRG